MQNAHVVRTIANAKVQLTNNNKMDTKITKGNAKAAMMDDAAHISYLKRDVLDDQKFGGKYKDENQTADEKHISKLAGDIKHDHSFLSKHWSHNR